MLFPGIFSMMETKKKDGWRCLKLNAAGEMKMKCPGQDTRYWQPGDIFEVKCPHCGQMIEFFKDDATRRCSQCGHQMSNPKLDFGCASYCKYAKQCIGDLCKE